jgi:MFS family permease
MLGSMYFVGYSISCLFVPRIADMYGRRWPYIISMSIQVLAFIGLLVCKNLMGVLCLILLFGLCGGGRSTVGFLYLMELVPKKDKRFTGTLNVAFDSFIYTMTAFFFWFMCKDTFYLLFMCAIGNFFVAIGIFFIPESPEYLYEKKEFQKTKLVLIYIAKFNGVKSDI